MGIFIIALVRVYILYVKQYMLQTKWLSGLALLCPFLFLLVVPAENADIAMLRVVGNYIVFFLTTVAMFATYCYFKFRKR